MRKLYMMLLLLLAASLQMMAQNQMQVNLKDGSAKKFKIEKIEKIEWESIPEEPYTMNFKFDGQGDWSIKDVSVSSPLTYVWSYNSKYGMVASAYYNNACREAESWLISPAIQVREGVMTIKNAGNKFGSAENVASMLHLLVSTDDAKTWTEVPMSGLPTGTDWTFVNSTADLSAYKGEKVRVALRYTSTSSVAGSWEIDSVIIQ